VAHAPVRERAVGVAAGFSWPFLGTNGRSVALLGLISNWDGRHHPMQRNGWGGILELFIPGLAVAHRFYK